MAHATLLKNGLIVDGSLGPGWVGDLLMAGERIVALAAPGQITPATLVAIDHLTEVDCTDRVIAPGFIDVHTHDDAAVLDAPAMLPKLSQGITTVIVGNCGISLAPVVTHTPAAPLSLLGNRQFCHASMAHYAQAVDAARPAVNVAALIGHTALRMRHMADLSRAATAEERVAMAAAMQEAMDAGALGLSSGIFYSEAYAADQEELVAVATVAARNGGVYATHIRDELAGILPALQEAALTARQSGLPLVLSHHKCAGPANWGRTRETLPLIDSLARNQEIGMDVYPYTAGSTVLREDLVDGVIDILITNSQPHPEMGGRYLADIAKQWCVTQQEAALRLKPGGACYFQMREDDVARVIAHPLSMIGSDGLPHDERPHPRLWGAFPRVLASYWRDKGVLRLEEAVHKMTGLSAQRFRLGGRGLLQAGHYADVVVFDPVQVRDMATFEQPQQFSEGIEQVWVNGSSSYTKAGRASGLRAGRFVHRGSQPAAR
ncbi:N-acyl-D-amino-acid deacylase family protein [Rhodoferax fermentans]|uniref:D-aminoacylase n=1 Tax=Rhodoferax fermentans TaxID=28066 RepID=A0A1T1AWQ0_RHOFE|nr:D-aminoacylase [Rhodoferax fermentans]MBK1685647.1 D-aminoacylase [Rhodoferax fermentans]OOV08385.1 D-aminoacylase [Rhodoferax fermentans]